MGGPGQGRRNCSRSGPGAAGMVELAYHSGVLAPERLALRDIGSGDPVDGSRRTRCADSVRLEWSGDSPPIQGTKGTEVIKNDKGDGGN